MQIEKTERRTRRQFVDAGYGQMHLRVASPGDDTESEKETPLVCLHQSPKSGREFAQFLEFSGAERMTIAPDYPGYGESDAPPASPMVRIEDYARSVWQALDALGVQGVVDLFGNHTGDSVAVEMAYQQSQRVRNIAMISAPVLTSKEQAEFDDYFQPVALDEQGSRYQSMWERINHHSCPEQTLEMRARSFAENLRGGEGYEWGHHAAFAYNESFISRLADLDHQIVVLNPADLLYEITSRVKPLLKNGQLIDLPNWSSAILDIYPKEIFKLLSDTFSSNEK